MQIDLRTVTIEPQRQTFDHLARRFGDKPVEPVAWTFTRKDGGRSFYTSLGHKSDFAQPEFCRLLRNSLLWAAALPIPTE